MAHSKINELIFRSIVMSLKEALVVVTLLGGVLAGPGPALAQSLDVKKPAPLQSGINVGTCDAFVGPHYWYFYAEPGSFSGTVTRRNSPGETIRANLGAGIAFAPKLQYSVVTSSDKADLTHFSGSVKNKDKVVVMIDPGRPGLVRSACNYEIQVSGAVSFGEVSTAPPISGTYEAMINDYGLTKFKDDGSLACANGMVGRWTLFDKDTATYVVNLNGSQMSLKLVPGRGLVDAANTDMVTFKQMH
jgi:hypothetical protein